MRPATLQVSNQGPLMKALNLILHTGANTVTREQIESAMTPEGTRTWQPIPHAAIIDGFKSAIESDGLHVVQESHGMTRDGNRYFGLMQLANGHNPDDWGLVVGLRNSHDKSFPAGIVVGSGVFVCDNLAFSGEVKLARKHTTYINRDLPQLIRRALGQVADHRGQQEKRIAAYKATDFTQPQAHDIIIRAVDSMALPVTLVPDVLKEWRTPRHDEFAANGFTAWRLFNAFTEVLKGNLAFLPKRTQTVHGLLDTAVSL